MNKTRPGCVDVINNDRGEITTIAIGKTGREAASAQIWPRLLSALDMAANANTQVLLLTGADRYFPGAAVEEAAKGFQPRHAIPGSPPEPTLPPPRLVTDLLSAFPAPTIMAIEGSCLDEGLELALACDIRIAATDALLGFPAIKSGGIPVLGGAVRLHRVVGAGRAAMLMLSGLTIHAERAFQLGLVEELAAPGEALATALTLAKHIVDTDPHARSLALQLTRQLPQLFGAEARAVEAEAVMNSLMEPRQSAPSGKPPHPRRLPGSRQSS